MGFSGIGFWEIVLIFAVIVIVMGPHRLPEIARTLGKWFRAIRKAGSDLSLGITRELEESKKKPPPPPSQSIENTPAPKKPKASAEDGHAAKPEGHQREK